ncbi:MAG: 2Fe-2S iron-sulfur cluster-binding protein, partial [Candidatus Humimicrobiaceae bacterium]
MAKNEKTIKQDDRNKIIKITINGKSYLANPGKTILEVAIENNIFIPNLCYDPRLKPQGACRLCLVEVEGLPEAVPSCITKISDGMKIIT